MQEICWIPGARFKNNGFLAPEIQVPNKDVFLKISAINASEGAIKLQLISNEKTEQVAVDMLGIEISKKPLILILWFGTLVAIVGVCMSLSYRIKNTWKNKITS